MKFKDILLYLKEQEEEDPNVNPEDELPVDPEDGEGFDFGDILGLNDQPQEPEDNTNDQPQEPTGEPEQEPQEDRRTTAPSEADRERHTTNVQRKLNAIDKLKEKWKGQAEQMGQNVTENDLSNAISFFNNKKNNLRALNGRNDLPQLYALQLRFPDFPGSNLQKIKDIQTYSWEQITFFTERYVDTPEEELPPEENTYIQIQGDVELKDLLPQAYEVWEKRRQGKIYDENRVTIIRIESKEMSISLGGLQQCLFDKYKNTFSGTPNKWCITHIGTRNLYTSYRSDASYYFVLNKNVPEHDDNRLFAIGASNTGSYALTKLYNDPNETKGLTLEDVARRTNCPQILNVKDKIKWFEETPEESIERSFDSYTFDGTNRTTDFAFQRPINQWRYIETGRPIKSGKSLKALGEVTIEGENEGQPMDLQLEYIRRTTKNAGDMSYYKIRYVTEDNSEEPFAMINALRKTNYRFLDNAILKYQLDLPDGVFAITATILNDELDPSWKDSTTPNIRLFQSKNSVGLFGVFNLQTFKWVKPLEYSKVSVTTPTDRQIRTRYTVIKYVSNNDYFYWIFPKDQNTRGLKDSFIKGKMYEGNDGDELIASLRR